MKNWICERCGKETGVIFRCEQCRKGVCNNCIDFKDGRQLCLDCVGSSTKGGGEKKYDWI